jgi:hypothetical protein
VRTWLFKFLLSNATSTPTSRRPPQQEEEAGTRRMVETPALQKTEEEQRKRPGGRRHATARRPVVQQIDQSYSSSGKDGEIRQLRRWGLTDNAWHVVAHIICRPSFLELIGIL